MCAALGRPEIMDNPRYATAELRIEHAHDLIKELDVAFGNLTAQEVRDALNSVGIAFGETHRITDVLTDQQMRDGGALRPVSDPRAGADLVADTPLFVAGETKAEPAMAPALGEHTDEVLQAAGYSEAEIARLRDADAVG